MMKKLVNSPVDLCAVLLSRRGGRFIKFGMVGLSNTLIALVVYYSLVSLGAHYQLANVASFIVSSLSGFMLNRIWVFRAAGGSVWSQIVKYYSVYVASLLISVGLSFLWVGVIQISKYVSPLLNLVFTIPFNYLLSKEWAFRAKGGHV